jgi:hypothetical protein
LTSEWDQFRKSMEGTRCGHCENDVTGPSFIAMLLVQPHSPLEGVELPPAVLCGDCAIELTKFLYVEAFNDPGVKLASDFSKIVWNYYDKKDDTS